MPDPCRYDSEDEWLAACIPARQGDNPDEPNDQSVAICYSMWRERECNKDVGKVYKAGEQSPGNPFEFIMSTAAVDRAGDIVDQDWDLREFRANPIALFGHDHDKVIGTWENVRVAGGRLLGSLKLAKAGTSALVDEIRSLVEQRILRAVSVGFRPGEYKERRGKDGNVLGLRLSKNVLYETSLVSVPMNPEALALVKGYPSYMAVTQVARSVSGPLCCQRSACEQLGVVKREPRDSGRTNIERKAVMPQTLSQRIESRENALNILKSQLIEVTESISDDGEFDENVTLQMTELKEQIERAESQITVLKSTESALAIKAQPARPHGASPYGQVQIEDPLAPKGHKVMAAFATILKAHVMRQNPLDLVKQEMGGHKGLEMVVRAATDAASMTDAAWAAPLVRTSWGEFLDLIRSTSVYPRAPGMRAMFDQFGTLTFPRETGAQTLLAGGFVGEGLPIRVAEGTLDSISATPKTLAVISPFTKALARHSVPTIQSVITNRILGDTAATLDTLFLDATARSAIRPAGLQDPTETGAANIVAATGTGTVADILVDVTALLGRVYAARAGDTGAWLMNPLRVLGLRNKQDAASGMFPFADEVSRGMFQGYPIIVSQNVTATVVSFITDQSMVHASDYSPRIEVSDQATLHFEDTTPLIIGTAGTPNTVAAPVRSLFQSDLVAVKMVQGMDWRVVRTGGVQVLTAVAW